MLLKKISVALPLLTLLVTNVSEADSFAFTALSAERNVPVPFGVQPGKFFSPLSCNRNSFQVPTDCLKWSEVNPDLSQTVSIPCGTCWIMDISDGRTLDLEGGLDVQGHLEIALDAAFEMITPVVLVQGSITYEPTEMYVSPENQNITFHFVGTEDLTFVPHEENAGVCGSATTTTPDSCEIGKKSFVMAGGQININAWPNKECPTWVKLYDTKNILPDVPDMSDYEPSEQPEGCTSRIFINEDFSQGTTAGAIPSGWEGSYGTTLVMTNIDGLVGGGHYLQSTGRTRDFQGPIFTIEDDIVNCMPSDTEYLISARAKLTSTLDRPSYCSQGELDGKYCLKVALQSMNDDSEAGFKILLTQTKTGGQNVPDGTWFTLSTTIKLSSSDIFTKNSVYHMIQFSGPEAGIEISIDDFVIKLPSLDSYPNTFEGMCSDLASINGNAQLDPISPFPFVDNRAKDSILSVEIETLGNTTNKFFRMSHRTKDWSSPTFTLPMECINAGSVYDFSAKIRIHTPNNKTKTNAQMMLKASKANEFADPPMQMFSIVRDADCPAQTIDDGWIACRSKFMFTEDHAAAKSLEFFIATKGVLYDLDIDDVSITEVRGPVDALILDESIEPCWGVGSEIILTSNTFNASDYSKGIIKEVKKDANTPAGKVVVTLKDGLQSSHTTEVRGGMVASEVALLTRNIQFKAATDDTANPFHGGHSKVMHTPNVTQIMEGIEIVNFGQQGNKGRYPMHMHMSGESPGTSFSYNTVRQSNQRCIVIHESHNITVEKNVLFDTFGHCLMLEDGAERGNFIQYNLGTMTKNTPDEGVLGITETDFFGATLWTASVLDNSFIGNVLAGSQDSGVWVEMLEHVRGPSEYLYKNMNPSRQIFKKFQGNTAHSNMRSGVRLYPNGHFPDEEGVYEDQISFRNNADGFVFHNSRFLTIKGGYFLDNRMGVQLDKGSDRMNVTGAYIEGFSELFREEVETRKEIWSHCPGFRPLSGIQLHSFLRFRDSQGYYISNITFANFNEEETQCWDSAAFDFDNEIRDGHYDATAHFKNITFHEGATMKEKLNMCDLETRDNQDKKYYSDHGWLHDLFMEDIEGAFDPQGLGRKGTVLSDHPKMTTFCPEHEKMNGSCAAFCPGKCYRTINYGIPPDPKYQNVIARATDMENGLYVDFESYITNYTMVKEDGTCCTENEVKNSKYYNRRYVSPTLPKGTYSIQFMQGNEIIWPEFAEETWGYPPIECDESNFLQEGDVGVIYPTVDENTCDNLVRNGDGSEGWHYWVMVGGERTNVLNGVGGPNDPAIASIQRTFNADGIGQYMNSQCLTSGTEYELTAKVKLVGVDPTTNNTIAVTCDPNEKTYLGYYACPRFAFRLRFNTMISEANQVDQRFSTEVLYMTPVGEVVNPTINGWNTMHGIFTIPPEMEAATSVMLFIERVRPNVEIHIDDVAIRPKTRGCIELISNGDVSSADTRFWKNYGPSKITAVDIPDGSGNSNHAIWVHSRGASWASGAQEIKTGCLTSGDAFKVTMKIALTKDGATWNCNPLTNTYESRCPTVILQAQKGTTTKEVEVATLLGSDWASGSFNEFYGEFDVTDFIEAAESIRIYPFGVHHTVDMLIDDLTMEPTVAWDCVTDGLLRNPGGELGDARFWTSWRGGAARYIMEGTKEGQFALIAESRSLSVSGIAQVITEKCLQKGVLYSVSVWVKLQEELTGNDFSCNPQSTKTTERCPVVSIAAENTGAEPSSHAVAGVAGEWLPGEWNQLTGVFHFFPSDLEAESTSITITDAPPGVDILVDNADVRIIRHEVQRV